jgi:hypothetical protein
MPTLNFILVVPWAFAAIVAIGDHNQTVKQVVISGQDICIEHPISASLTKPREHEHEVRVRARLMT